MHLLLCAATEFEISPIYKELQKQYPGKLEVLVTGVGLTAATYSLTRMVCMQRPDMIIQAGVAGTFDPAMKLGDVVAVASETIGDLGVEENGGFRSIAKLALADQDQLPWSGGRLINDHEILDTSGLPQVHAVTVNEISTDQKRILYYHEELEATVESMEGAALHFVALQEQIPFLQLRALSNYVGERNKAEWLLGAAIINLNKKLEELVHKILAS
ncbi:MAG: futalosine hydrolase [Flavisolibacter sp.]